MKQYRFPTDEGSLSWKEMKQLINDASMVVMNDEIAVIRSLLVDALTRLGYLFRQDWTSAWDAWGNLATTVCQDEIAEVVDRLAQYLRYLMNGHREIKKL